MEVINLVTDKINEYINKGLKIVIHCHMGISRAPTMIIAYLIRFKKIGFEKAFDFLKSKSDVIDPNAGFLMQLHELET